MAATPPTPTRLPRAERRRAVLDAAARAFSAAGFAGTSMEDVAREAGVTRLIVYRIFDSKEALYRAVLSDVIDDLAARFQGWEALAPEQRPPIARLLLDTARAHPDAFRLLWRHAAREPEFAEVVALFRAWVERYADDVLAEAVTDRTLRRWAAAALVDHLYEGVCLWLDHGDPAKDDEFVAAFAAGARALIRALRDRGR